MSRTTKTKAHVADYTNGVRMRLGRCAGGCCAVLNVAGHRGEEPVEIILPAMMIRHFADKLLELDNTLREQRVRAGVPEAVEGEDFVVVSNRVDGEKDEDEDEDAADGLFDNDALRRVFEGSGLEAPAGNKLDALRDVIREMVAHAGGDFVVVADRADGEEKREPEAATKTKRRPPRRRVH